MRQADDFRAEVDALAAILDSLGAEDFEQQTLFKNWTINDVIGHLYMFDVAAGKTLHSGDDFQDFFTPILKRLGAGQTLLEVQMTWLDGLAGPALRDIWRQNAETVAGAYGVADPKLRLKWAGPDMSVRSSITARQMETWSHGQEIFDLLGVGRLEHDRIRNIVHLGVSTYGWTFANRGERAPEPAPYVRLRAPSGAVWTWNEVQHDNAVTGDAVDFARVVTQVRNIADTALETQGAAARQWMAVAQCFAGPPQPPPAPGERYTRKA